MPTSSSLCLADLPRAIDAMTADLAPKGGITQVMRVEAIVRRPPGLETLLTVEAALRATGLADGRCEFVWSCEAVGDAPTVSVRMIDAARRPLLERSFRITPDSAAGRLAVTDV